jgi:hypothetical protein
LRYVSIIQGLTEGVGFVPDGANLTVRKWVEQRRKEGFFRANAPLAEIVNTILIENKYTSLNIPKDTTIYVSSHIFEKYGIQT